MTRAVFNASLYRRLAPSTIRIRVGHARRADRTGWVRPKKGRLKLQVLASARPVHPRHGWPCSCSWSFRQSRSVMADDSTSHAQANYCNTDDEADRQQNRRNHATNTPGIRQRSAVWGHCAGINLLKVPRSHHPGGNAEWGAHYKAQYAKDQNEGSSMWFHIRFTISHPGISVHYKSADSLEKVRSSCAQRTGIKHSLSEIPVRGDRGFDKPKTHVERPTQIQLSQAGLFPDLPQKRLELLHLI